MNVNEVIGNLLIRYNCVIIPGFGGFVAKQASAHIDYKNGLITPPKKSLLFNRQLINNDGLLVTEIGRLNDISYDQANDLVKEMTSQWNSDLSAGNRISIDKVGFLFFDQEKNICFEQDREFNLLLSSFGLGSVHFLTENDVAIVQHKAKSALEQPTIAIETSSSEIETPIITVVPSMDEVTPVEKTEIIEEAEAIAPTLVTIGGKSKKSNFWKVAAAACLIPILFYSMWIPMKTDVLESRMISFHDFNPFHKAEVSTYEQKSIKEVIPENIEVEKTLEEQLAEVEISEDVYSYNFSEDTYVLVDIKKEEAVETEVKTEEIKTITPVISNTTDKLHYIIGCFSIGENAQNLVDELISKGFDAKIKDVKNGLHRVSIGGSNSEQDITKLINKAKEAGYSGWILK